MVRVSPAELLLRLGLAVVAMGMALGSTLAAATLFVLLMRKR